MSLVSSVITDIRVEIADTSSTLYTDDTTMILPLVKQTIRRANRIIQINDLHFGKKKVSPSTTANQAFLTFTAMGCTDLDIPCGLYRTDTDIEIEQLTPAEWETVGTCSALSYYLLDLENSKILFAGTPTEAVALSFWYFPTIDPSVYTTASTMPWSGKLDDIISRYVSLRLQNIAEMDVSTDQGILAEMEASITRTYGLQSPTVLSSKGWMNG
jgi:hypothetical protein